MGYSKNKEAAKEFIKYLMEYRIMPSGCVLGRVLARHQHGILPRISCGVSWTRRSSPLRIL